MKDYFLKKFVKNYEDITNDKVREEYGVFASIVGIITNIILFIVKIVIGLIAGSVSIVADALNNLTDSLGSIISLVSFKLSARPADKEHPFGHGRVEYIASLAVAVFIGVIALEVFRSSIKKIQSPEIMDISLPIIAILICTVLAKLWQSFFYKKIGNRINSKVLFALSKDSLSDVIATSLTIVSAMVLFFLGINIDGYMGILVTLFLIKAAYEIISDTLSTIIGEKPSQELCQKIKEEVEGYDGILGVHDLIVHSYGANKFLATMHAEVSSKSDMVTSHSIVDNAEFEVGQKLGIHLTLHMDPIDVDNPLLERIRSDVNEFINKEYKGTNCHDFRFVNSGKKINVIFDLAVPHEYNIEMQNQVQDDLKKIIKKIDDKFECKINVEYSYTTL